MSTIVDVTSIAPGTSVTVDAVTQEIVVQISRGEPGPPGLGAVPADLMSTDANNRLRLGADNKLLVPELIGTTPVAYYILAKS